MDDRRGSGWYSKKNVKKYEGQEAVESHDRSRFEGKWYIKKEGIIHDINS